MGVGNSQVEGAPASDGNSPAWVWETPRREAHQILMGLAQHLGG